MVQTVWGSPKTAAAEDSDGCVRIVVPRVAAAANVEACGRRCVSQAKFISCSTFFLDSASTTL